MPSFGDSAVLILLVLLLFGPKQLPILARQLGKLMGDFRRASNEFRSQMEDELRVSEQADRQKEIAAIEAAAPQRPPVEHIAEPVHPHTPTYDETADDSYEPSYDSHYDHAETHNHIEPHVAPEHVDSLPIATSGELKLMPPATGLPVANTSLAPFLDAIPAVPESGHGLHETEPLHG
jgi:sec-independent protein translocase protein TatB